MKKLLTETDNLIEPMVSGVLAAHPGMLVRAGTTGRALVRSTKTKRKVGIVIGGGSGHEPAFLGYVGRGLADGVALGNIFASPSPGPIVDAARAVDTGQGILLIYGNYAGDCMNFEMAQEALESEGIPVKSVVVNDDIASSTQRDQRRGIAGEILTYKVAGSMAERGGNLDELATITQEAVDNTYSIGAAWSPCTLPQTGLKSFEIGEDDMEIGLGVHGEPGAYRRPMASAGELAEIMVERLLSETTLSGPIAVLVNGLGSTSLMELYTFYGELHKRLATEGAHEVKTMIGNYITSQEMAGCSVTIMHLDDLRAELLLAPCQGLGWSQ